MKYWKSLDVIEKCLWGAIFFLDFCLVLLIGMMMVGFVRVFIGSF